MGAIIAGNPIKLRFFRSDKHHVRIGRFVIHRWWGIPIFILGFLVFMYGLGTMKANIWDIAVSVAGAALALLGWKIIEPWRQTIGR